MVITACDDDVCHNEPLLEMLPQRLRHSKHMTGVLQLLGYRKHHDAQHGWGWVTTAAVLAADEHSMLFPAA